MDILYLKKIELFGFKSFADKTEVIFNQGVTCIVGPNGCGKSNISDALRWVLGERSPKHLRSSQMTDVIFAGTELRKPLGMAEVNLIFDNHTRWLPIDYNEVVITRRVYNSGESEYLINKTKCRYRDIQALIVDTGLGMGSYSMMEQGRVDYILNATPEERRGLIEEAAGVAKFKVQKEEALRKLTLTEENLTRLRDIVQEVERNIKYAERQAKRAERYKTQLDTLKQMEITKAFLDIDESKTKQSRLDEEIARLRLEIQATEEEQNAERAQQNDLESRLTISEKALRERLEIRAERKGKLEYDFNQIEQLKKQMAELKQICANAEKDRQEAELRLAELKTQIEASEQDYRPEDKNSAVAESELLEKQNSLAQIKSDINRQRELVEQARDALFESADLQSKQRNELERLKLELVREEERHKRLSVLQDRQLKEREELRKKLQDIETERRELLVNDNGILENYNKKFSEQATLEQELSAINEKMASLTVESSELATKIAVLRRLSKKGLLPWSTARAFLSESDGKISEALSAAEALAEVIKPKQGHEHLYHLAVGKFMDALIVQDESAVHEIIDVLTKKRWGEATLLLANQPVSAAVLSDGIAKHPLILGPAIDFVECSAKHRPLAELVLSGTYISVPWSSEHKAALRQLSQKSRLITTDGMILGPGSRVQVGIKPEENAADAWDSESYASAEKRLSECERESAELKDRKISATHQLGTIAEELRSTEPGLRTARVKLESSQHVSAQLAKDYEHLEEALKLNESDIQLSLAEQAKAQQHIGRLTNDVGASITEETNAKERLHYENERLEDLERQKEALASEVAELGAESKHLNDRITLSSLSQTSLRSNFDLLSSLVAEKKKTIADAHEKQQGLGDLLSNTLSDLEQAKSEDEKYSAEIREFESQIESVKKERKEGADEIEFLHRKIAGLKDAEHAKELERTDCLHRQDAVHQQIRQAYKIELAGLNRAEYDAPSAEELAQFNEKVTKLRENLETLGTVNLLAIEEYEELKTRFEFLSSQQKDLETSRESLLEAIRKINRTTRKLFQDTFHQIQANFEQYYRILFRGGHAELIMLDEENPLESGIDIHVRPPGKKLQHISLMSGGEKALTTIALMFSLFKAKPSPFCVLDEVDAPLDEANIDRFLDVLREFLTTTQFLIITHNRKTISTGDTLYGVTMEESGVSSIVSVRVAENGNLAPSSPAGPAPSEVPAPVSTIPV